ncbi:MAG: prohibitin family protein [Candidatus Aenigmarchaeota archaeon]|nr:prohibitin family protein [Candidatus Aenigmarchaeota archaeon]
MPERKDTAKPQRIVIEDTRKNRTTRKWLFVPVVIILLMLIFGAFVIVPAGHRGVILTWGAVDTVKIFGEGLHFKIPVVQNVEKMEVRTKKYSALATSASKDLQDVSAEVALNYHLDVSRVNEIYQRLGLEFEDRIIAPAIQESVKASTAKFNAEELITQRPLIKQEIEDVLRDRLEQFGIILEIVSITEFTFSPEFTVAIEEKQVAEQRALKAQNDLKRIEIEAQQKVASARGEAESIQIINEELEQSPRYLEWLATNKWNGQLPLVTGDGVTPFIQIPTP